MAITAGSAVFVDTNVLIYSTFSQIAWHSAAQQRLAEIERNSGYVLDEPAGVARVPGRRNAARLRNARASDSFPGKSNSAFRNPLSDCQRRGGRYGAALKAN